MKKSQIGLIGLAVMGENLCLNMESKGFSVAVYNRTPEKTHNFIKNRAAGKNITGYTDIAEFVAAIETPRKIMLMVKAGSPVDSFIEILLPHLSQGDTIIDGGNTHYPDTIRRTKYLEEKGFLYIGTGVSGGEEGALIGPSIMPGGSAAAWDGVKPIFQKIAAQVNGVPCCNWVGADGAGHFVKMVHNGIEYGDMQLICEAYQLMRSFGFSTAEMGEIFATWNNGVLNSYLIEITADILKYHEDGEPLIDKILDTAGQKGTGKWTSVAALDLGIPLTLISEAVFARCLSAQKAERVHAAEVFSIQQDNISLNQTTEDFAKSLEQALYAAKIVSYAQGYNLLKSASEEYGWNLNFGEIAMMWRGGCIIRSAFLNNIKQAYDKNPKLQNLMLDEFFQNALKTALPAWRKICGLAIQSGVPAPAFFSALSYFDGYSTANLPANLLQAQRDYFGAHMYERTDRPRGEFFHTNWTGRGGETASSTYNV